MIVYQIDSTEDREEIKAFVLNTLEVLGDRVEFEIDGANASDLVMWLYMKIANDIPLQMRGNRLRKFVSII